MALIFETIVQEDLNVGTGTTTVTSPSGGSLAGTQVGIHTLGVGQAKVDQVWDPATIASGGSATTTVTVSGAALGDFVLVAINLNLQGMDLSAHVSAANTVTVVLANPTGSGIDLGSGTVSVLVLKSR